MSAVYRITNFHASCQYDYGVKLKYMLNQLHAITAITYTPPTSAYADLAGGHGQPGRLPEHLRFHFEDGERVQQDAVFLDIAVPQAQQFGEFLGMAFGHILDLAGVTRQVV
jgi:hypothetical protein